MVFSLEKLRQLRRHRRWRGCWRRSNKRTAMLGDARVDVVVVVVLIDHCLDLL
jgi:hypothetical protein